MAIVAYCFEPFTVGEQAATPRSGVAPDKCRAEVRQGLLERDVQTREVGAFSNEEASGYVVSLLQAALRLSAAPHTIDAAYGQEFLSFGLDACQSCGQHAAVRESRYAAKSTVRRHTR